MCIVGLSKEDGIAGGWPTCPDPVGVLAGFASPPHPAAITG
jgi:hypothetical protein